MFDTPLIDMYGGNVDKLRSPSLKQRVDPHNVMGFCGTVCEMRMDPNFLQDHLCKCWIS
jgi:hypothetical protein